MALVAGAFLAGLLIAGAGFYAWLSNRDRNAQPPLPSRFAIVLPEGLQLVLGRGSAVVVSPDGGHFVYAARAANGPAQLFLRERSKLESTAIEGTEGAEPRSSRRTADGSRSLPTGKLKKVPLEGGAPVVLGDAQVPRGHAWLQDDGILVTPANNVGLLRIPANGGTAQAFTSLAAGELSHRWPRQLPDASAVLFSVWNDTGFEGARIAAQRAGSSERVTVVEAGGSYPRMVRDPASRRDYLLYARSEGLLAAPFDARALKVTGTSVPIVDGVLTNLSGGAHFDIGSEGTLAYVPGTHGEADREMVWVTLDGKATPARGPAPAGRFFSLDDSGTRVMRMNTVGARQIWVDDLQRNTRTRLATGTDVFVGTWTPDGKWVIYSAGAPVANLFRVPSDGTGSQERLTSSTRNQHANDVSPDGAWLAYHEYDPLSKADVWVMRLPAAGAAPAAQPEARRIIHSDASDSLPSFSHDGRWLAYQSNTTGRFEIYIRAFPDGDKSIQVSTDGGIEPKWSPVGNELHYRDLKGMLMAATLTTPIEGSVIRPRVLFDARRYENQIAIAPDGKRFLLAPLVTAEATPTQINVIVNFFEELRQRVR